ncbi:hypothetical protein M422DRAFT_56350 [Sphaerobolus stellatus SS14]|uniref:Uncharacterized protein n=1 Tax=Sphaerobolus stellatus (strain SS14) TaxID=990650 RepID=A0A0C9UGN6_SPHS4|nr:hypothetical protein M422DRAFT_56350 [Sphaerobolus stellatus SS14]
MARDANPDMPGEDGLWFKVRKDGEFIDPPLLFQTGGSDSKLGWIGLGALNTTATQSVSASKIINLIAPFDTADKGLKFSLDLDGSSSPSKDNDPVDMSQYGLQKVNPIVLEVNDNNSDNPDNNGDNPDNNGDQPNNDGDNPDNNGDQPNNDGDNPNDNGGQPNDDDDNNDDDDDGDYPPGHNGKKGYWFCVTNKKGKYVDLSDSATAVSKKDSYVGWNPIPKSSISDNVVASGKIKKKICQSLGLNTSDYKLYASQADDDDDFYADNYVVELDQVGLKSNNPMLLKYKPGNENSSSDDSSSEENANTMNNSNRNTGYTGNTDQYSTFTRRLQNITSGNWDIYYPDAITGTYNGEILWTDGNSNHCFATAPNIAAFRVVRRNPCTPDGAVVNYGLASANSDSDILLMIPLKVPTILHCWIEFLFSIIV